MLGEQSVCSPDDIDSMDQVDGLEMPGHSNYSPQILIKLEESLGDVMGKVSELRYGKLYNLDHLWIVNEQSTEESIGYGIHYDLGAWFNILWRSFFEF